MRFLRTTLGVLCVIGAAFSLLVVLVVSLGYLVAKPSQADGTILGYERELTGRSLGSLRYFPFVEYTDASGMRHSFRSESGLLRPSYATGAVIRVAYYPSDNPKHRSEKILTGTRSWIWAALAFVSMIPFVVGAHAFLNERSIRETVLRFRHAPKAA